MKKSKLFLLSVLLVLIQSCKTDTYKEPTGPQVYHNIIVRSDLSSRIYNSSPNDTMVIKQIESFFVNNCVRPGQKVNDRSALSFSRLNHMRSKCKSMTIDINNYYPLSIKQKFVNSKSEDGGLKAAIERFNEVVKCNYAENDDGGLDILSLIYNDIRNGNLIKKPESLKMESYDIDIVYRNHYILLTDGYLEYNRSQNSDFYYGNNEIDLLRQYCIENKVSPIDAIDNVADFRIRPLKHESNGLVDLYVLETYDRGTNKDNGTFNYTGDLSDNEILRLVWKKWATDSGFRSFTWKMVTSPSSMPHDYFAKIIKG